MTEYRPFREYIKDQIDPTKAFSITNFIRTYKEMYFGPPIHIDSDSIEVPVKEGKQLTEFQVEMKKRGIEGAMTLKKGVVSLPDRYARFMLNKFVPSMYAAIMVIAYTVVNSEGPLQPVEVATLNFMLQLVTAYVLSSALNRDINVVIHLLKRQEPFPEYADDMSPEAVYLRDFWFRLKRNLAP